MIRDRETPDLIVIWLAGIVGFVVVVSVVGGIIWRINDPDANLTELTSRIGDIVNTLIGAVVGYLAGRGVIPKTEATQELPGAPSWSPDDEPPIRP